jgi:hypothetical protein
MKKGIFLTITMSMISPLAYSGEYKIHILKNGETLSELLQSHGYSPLYGKEKWVEKTLQINHLQSVNAKELKKGFPVILPNRNIEEPKQVATTKVIYKNRFIKSIPKKSLFNTISKHQDLLFGIRYSQNAMGFNDTNIYQNENYKLSFKVQGKNDYQLRKLTYNFFGGISTTTPGIGRFESNSEKSVTFKPTYNFSSGIKIHTKLIPFEFGPTVALEEKSLIQSSGSGTSTRRDQLGWVGFNISKDFKAMNQLFKANFHYQRKAVQSSLTDSKIFDASTLEANFALHLTENYIVGLNSTSTSYEKIEVKREDSLGINFNYLVK